MRTNVGQYWQYPTSHPSNRFNTFNALQRQLDEQWHELAESTQAEWQEYCLEFPWECDCDPDEPPHEDSPFDEPGQVAHRSVNTMRYMLGQGYTGSPTLPSTAADGDAIALAVSQRPPPAWPPPPGYLTAIWRRRSGPVSGPYTALVQFKGCNCLPQSGPAASKYKFAMLSDISYNVTLDLTPGLIALPGLLALRCLAVRIMLSDTGIGPFAGPRSAIQLV